MTNNDAKSKLVLGFLTVVEHPQFGLFGGYLLLNAAGRPLEFHCTTPIKPNRAQEILYGPTLESFLYGEQIGLTLIRQAEASPLLICTDREPAMAAREHAAVPVVLVLPNENNEQDTANAETPIENPTGRILRLDAAHVGGPRLASFRLGRNRLALPERADDDRQLVAARLGELADSFDLAEPFQRIRDAIDEAQQAAR